MSDETTPTEDRETVDVWMAGTEEPDWLDGLKGCVD